MRGKLQIRYTVDGERFEETLDLPDTRSGVADAVRIRKARIEARIYGTSIQERDFWEVAQAYLTNLKEEVELATYNGYRDSLNNYWKPLAGKDMATLTTAHVIALDDSIEWQHPKTRANALTPLRGTFEYARSRGWIQHNPAEALKGKKSKGDPDPYTEEERDLLLTHLDSTLAGEYYRIAFGTGARTSELLALTWAAYDGSSLYIDRARVRGRDKGTKTENSRRRVLLHPEIVEVLNGMVRPIQGGHIICNQYGRPYQSGYHLNKWFRKAHKATGVRYRTGPNPWRHTYASIALSDGVKPMLVARQLGDRLDTVLSRYAKYVPREDDMAEILKMSKTKRREA